MGLDPYSQRTAAIRQLRNVLRPALLRSRGFKLHLPIAGRAWQEGASAVIHGRDTERGRAIADELGVRARFVPGDLAEPEVPSRLVGFAVSEFDKLDAIVNNAAWVVRSDIYTTDAVLF